MVTAGPSEPSDAAAAGRARDLAVALDAIEAELDRLALGAPPRLIADALKAPVQAFDAAARDAMGEP